MTALDELEELHGRPIDTRFRLATRKSVRAAPDRKRYAHLARLGDRPNEERGALGYGHRRQDALRAHTESQRWSRA